MSVVTQFYFWLGRDAQRFQLDVNEDNFFLRRVTGEFPEDCFITGRRMAKKWRQDYLAKEPEIKFQWPLDNSWQVGILKPQS